MNEMEEFLTFGAVVKIRKEYDDDLYKFIELMKSIGFLRDMQNLLRKIVALIKNLMNFRKIDFGTMSN